MKKVLSFFRVLPSVENFSDNWGYVECELCFYVEVEHDLKKHELAMLKWLLAETFEPNNFSDQTFLTTKTVLYGPGGGQIVEIGPRLNFETAYSTNAVSVCRACGLDMVTRLEQSRRYLIHWRHEADVFVEENSDRMTECWYKEPLQSFTVDLQPQPVFEVDLIGKGIEALRRINAEIGLGMDAWDLEFYHKLFAEDFKRNPTNVECFQLGQANSEHCRHWYFKGQIIINGVVMPESLLDVVRSTLRANKANSVIAFSDNSSAINGYNVQLLQPEYHMQLERFSGGYYQRSQVLNPLFTAETHNFPSGVAPFPGAETGAGGRIRDVQATGRGGLVIAGTAGYCIGNLLIPGYSIPGETAKVVHPENLASPLKILIDASNGASRYGNEFGEAVIQGFARSFGQRIPNGEFRSWFKPIMFTGGVGQLASEHLEKKPADRGMLVVQIGGPAYRIGIGGGAASSMIQGENKASLDFNAVQRGNAEMEQKMNRVIRACVEMDYCNPIMSIHDQGAGGPCNVVTEIVHPAGGLIDIRQIAVGDKTMSVLELWGGEYQERNALLIWSSRYQEFERLCKREKVNCEVLGQVTGDGKIVLVDSSLYETAENYMPVNLELEKILGDMPQKTFSFERPEPNLKPLKLPSNITVRSALKRVLKQVSVGSKGYLVHKVDRSVTGLVVQQQCCGPQQIAIADVAVVAQSHLSNTGIAISIGEQPIKMLVNPEAGARMAVGEMLTNMMGVKISGLEDIKCSGNWMAAAKLPGEGALVYDAAVAMRDLMIELGIAVDGGKDSLSMAAKVNNEIVKAPTELVISGYATVPDISKIVSPDIKRPGESKLMYLRFDFRCNEYRLGGSALAQSYGQIGDECPDLHLASNLINAFNAVQELVDNELILACHDISDGGIIATVLEMAMAKDCGVDLKFYKHYSISDLEFLFSEELGVVIEYLPSQANDILNVLSEHAIEMDEDYLCIGSTRESTWVTINYNGIYVFEEDIKNIRSWWESTSHQLERLQNNPVCADGEFSLCKGSKISLQKQQELPYQLTFDPKPTSPEIITRRSRPVVAIIREEGSNGDREMAGAFYEAGFAPLDITMTDLLNGSATLDGPKGVAFVGGFSYADVFDSAKGWAGTIKFNERLSEMFGRFYRRPDTFSLGVCNGCQLMALIGWAPYWGLIDECKPRFIHNNSGRFESRWSTVKILDSPALMLKDMAGSILGVHVAHGEGRLHFPSQQVRMTAEENKLFAMAYVDQLGRPTEQYPFNPNGSPGGVTALCSMDGRHLAMMPHPERAFLKWQWHYMPEEWKKSLEASPWLKMFQNARAWVDQA